MIKAMLIAGLGGFAGTCCRFLIGRWCIEIFHEPFPLGTFIVNIIGCFLIGIIFGIFEKSYLISPHVNVMLVTGFCGGFTTFSAFANEIWMLGDNNDWSTAALYFTASVICGVLLVWAGRALIR